MFTPNESILEFKSFHIFYENLYLRLFNLINHLIDENQYNINSTKDQLRDFLDNYSYYIISKKMITRDVLKKGFKMREGEVMDNLKKFDEFTQTLNKYPSIEFSNIRRELIKQDFDITKVNYSKFTTLTNEYYAFFDEVITILKNFISVASENGFLPVMKNKNSLRSIGFANYKGFFSNLENLKLKMSEITTTIQLNNIFKCRRCMFCLLVIFSPYFKKTQTLEQLEPLLEFKFILDEDLMRTYKKSFEYKSFYDMGRSTQQDLNERVLTPLKTNISLIKRYISFEFGEIDLTPQIKKKYGFDPTWT